MLIPQHWVLLEICWHHSQLRFYDSLPLRRSAAADESEVRMLACGLLQILHNCCKQEQICLSDWKWIGEMVSHLLWLYFPSLMHYMKRGSCQSNSFDCGAFVCADLASLVESGLPSEKREEDMLAWRNEVLVELTKCDIHTLTRNPPPPGTEVIYVDHEY